MSHPATPADFDRPRHAAAMDLDLDDVAVIACVYGPRTTGADLERMQPLGDGWTRGIAQWRASGAPYLLLVARAFGGGTHGEPVALLAHDRAAVESAIWRAMAPSDQRLCLLESFEPEFVPFVRMLIAATRQGAGHA